KSHFGRVPWIKSPKTVSGPRHKRLVSEPGQTRPALRSVSVTGRCPECRRSAARHRERVTGHVNGGVLSPPLLSPPLGSARTYAKSFEIARHAVPDAGLRAGYPRLHARTKRRPTAARQARDARDRERLVLDMPSSKV